LRADTWFAAIEPQSDSESDQEDEFGQMVPQIGGPPPPTSGSSEANIAMKNLKAQLEKKKHEAFLAKIFGLEKHAAKTTPAPSSEKVLQPKAVKDLHKAFVRGLAPLAKLLKSTDDDASQKAFDLIVSASKKYLESDGSKDAKAGTQSDTAVNSTAQATPASSILSIDAVEDVGPGLFDKSDTKKRSSNYDPDAANPDDINVEEPETVELSIEPGIPNAETESQQDDESTVDSPVNDAAEAPGIEKSPIDAKHSCEISKPTTTSEERDYLRQTRGLPLEELAISLIPIKASVLTRAIDFNCLKEITLLNVGPQTPLWKMLSKEYDVSSLKLRKIHTDHVTIELLAFLNRLERVDELLMFERIQKPRVESTTAKTTVTIEQIRKAVLKKHASTLKVLVIRNDSNSTEWDMNIETTMLLCQRAKALEELAVAFSVQTMVSNAFHFAPIRVDIIIALTTSTLT
jgi:hypothetical protein